MDIASVNVEREISVSISDQELKAFTDFVWNLPISENNLGNFDLQEQLRFGVATIFPGVEAAVAAGKEVAVGGGGYIRISFGARAAFQ